MDFFQILIDASAGLYARAFLNFWEIFGFLFLQIFFVFVNMEHYGIENFKTLLLLQITVENF